MTDQSKDSELLSLRRDKIEKLRALGVEPYAYRSSPSHTMKGLLEEFEQLQGAAGVVTIAGRIRSWRPHGGSIFFNIEDSTGRVQAYAKKDSVGEKQFNILGLMDIGDFIEVTGTLFVTKMGERTVSAQMIRVLSKSLRPLPSEWYGLKDVEIRFRQRYLDFLMNPDVRQKIASRSEMIREIRTFLHERGFIEIDNPLLETVPSGALSKPFQTHINAYDMDIYLRICISELWQKRSIIGGFDKVFEMGKAFRNEGVSFQHNPEFTMLEYYWAYGTLEQNMQMHEALFERLAMTVCGSLMVEHSEQIINFTAPYPRKTFRQSIIEAAAIDIEDYPDEESLFPLLKRLHVEYNMHDSYGQLLDQLFKFTARPKLLQPTFITEYPVQLKPLAKAVEGNARYSDTFQLLIAGMEVSNSYNELNDPIEQRARFEEQTSFTAAGSEEAMLVDEDYIKALEYGMPPTTGTGIGIDRLAALLTNSHHLREVITYPIMKPEKKIGDSEDLLNPVGFLPLVQSDPEIFSIDADVATRFPGLKIGLAIIEGVTVEKTNAKLASLKAGMLPQLEQYSKDEWRNSGPLMHYRDMYKKFGVDPSSKRPSADALLHRLSHGKGLYSINTVVDTYNLFSAKHEHCMAAYDADQVRFPLQLRASIEGDSVKLIGDEAVSSVEPGRLVYADQESVTCLNFNYRDAERTKVTEQTKRLILFVDGCKEMTYAEIHASLSQTATALADVTGGHVVSVSITTSEESDREPTKAFDTSEFIQDALQGEPGITRAEALELMESMIENVNLRKHALAVEAAVRYYARKLGANEDLWGIAGLLHDADWEAYPKQHPTVIVEKLRALGVHPAIPQAIACHGKDFGFPQVSQLDKYLFACDELTGLITATALVRPDKSLTSVEVKSVKKKLKDKTFAKGVHREDVYYGLDLIGLELETHIQNVLSAMQAVALGPGL